MTDDLHTPQCALGSGLLVCCNRPLYHCQAARYSLYQLPHRNCHNPKRRDTALPTTKSQSPCHWRRVGPTGANAAIARHGRCAGDRPRGVYRWRREAERRLTGARWVDSLITPLRPHLRPTPTHTSTSACHDSAVACVRGISCGTQCCVYSTKEVS